MAVRNHKKDQVVDNKASNKKHSASESVRSSRKLKPKNEHRSYTSFRLSKRIKSKKQMPKARLLFVDAFRLIKTNVSLFVGISVIFFFAYIVFIRGIGGGVDITELETLFTELLEGAGQVWSATALLAFLVTDVGTTSSDVASVYQGILYVVISLAVIYATRMRSAAKAVTVKRSFYESMYPLIPFLLVLLVIGVQLLPLVFGSWVFNVAVGGGLAISSAEQFGFGVVFFLFGLLSVYMVSSSIFALYIVTLPGMTPLSSLRSARELVRFRRWEVVRKVLFLPFALSVIGLIILLPTVLVLTPVAEFIVLGYSLAAIMFSHVYMYVTYRALL